MSTHKPAHADSENCVSEDQCYVDRFGRHIDNLRISLTQDCCFSCFFCHKEGEDHARREISAEQIERIVKHASRHGVHNVKLTGGEPLLRKDILDIIRRISPHVSDLSITTNGVFLDEMSEDLKEAGLTRVNVSIHSLESETYYRITGFDELERVKRGIKRAIDVGLSPVKINMTILRGYNEDGIADLMGFASEMGAILQIIELQQIPGVDSSSQMDLWVDLGPLEESLRERAIKTEKRRTQSRYQYTIALGSQRSVVVEIVRPMYNAAFCDECTRLRVTSDGKLKPCLYRLDNMIEVFSCGDQTSTIDTVELAFEQAVSNREPYWREDR